MLNHSTILANDLSYKQTFVGVVKRSLEHCQATYFIRTSCHQTGAFEYSPYPRAVRVHTRFCILNTPMSIQYTVCIGIAIAKNKVRQYYTRR